MNRYHKKAKEIQHYLEQLTAEEDEVLKTVKKRMEQHRMPPISITPLIGKLLKFLARLSNAERILEIGTLGGYSAIWLARALPETGKLISLELNAENAAIAKENIRLAGLNNKIEIRIGNALKLMEKMIANSEEPFDLIFLDGDKPSYPLYINPMIKLAQEGSLIIADNLVRRGKVITPSLTDEQAKALAAFNQQIARHPQLESVIIPTLAGYAGGDLDGLGVSRVLSS